MGLGSRKGRKKGLLPYYGKGKGKLERESGERGGKNRSQNSRERTRRKRKALGKIPEENKKMGNPEVN